MWRPDEEILDDLHSNNPDRIAAGIRDLEVRIYMLDEFELAPLDISILEPFGGVVPGETLVSLLYIFASYKSFTSPIPRETLRDYIIELVLRYDEDYIALQASLILRVMENPIKEIITVLEKIAERGLKSEQEIRGAGYFVSYLIGAQPEVRAATIQTLRQWPDRPEYRRVIDYILPELTSEEQALLKESQ